MENRIVVCKRCGCNLGLPANKGILAVTCPKCKYEFRFDSGPKPIYREVNPVNKGHVRSWAQLNTMNKKQVQSWIQLIIGIVVGIISAVIISSDTAPRGIFGLPTYTYTRPFSTHETLMIYFAISSVILIAIGIYGLKKHK